MGNGALPHGPSHRAHPRLYLLRRKLSVSFGTQEPTFVELPESDLYKATLRDRPWPAGDIPRRLQSGNQLP